MKYCPNCRTQYTDESLQYCLQDGSPLAEVSQTNMKTAEFGETETVVSNRSPNRVSIDYQRASADNWRAPTTSQNTSAPHETPKKSRTGLAVALTALIMLVLFGGIGIGAWLYLKNHQADITNNNSPVNAANNAANQNAVNKNANAKTPSPTPARNANVNSNANNANALPPAAAAAVKKEVGETIDGWKSAAEAHNLDAYMDKYADKIDYYNKKGANSDTVRDDKSKAFDKYDSIEINISNLSVTPDATGNRAVAVFDKEWKFENDEKISNGKVRTQLELENTGGEWRITGEKDLKVYYSQ